MAPATQILEQELREAQTRVRTLEHEAARDKEAADQLVADLKESGRNPLIDAEAFEQVDAAYKVGDEKRHEATRIRERLDALMGEYGEKAAKSPTARRLMSAAQAIHATPEFQRLLEAGVFDSQAGKIEVPGVEIVSRDDTVARIRAGLPLLAADPAVDGAALVPLDQRLYPPVGIPVRPLRMVDLITVGTTERETVEYTKETVRTDAAAETAVGTAYAEATYTYALESASVKTIGHYTSAARTQLADQGQLQTLIEGRLQYGVDNRLDGQILNGDGTGQNLTGILHTSGIGAINRNGTASERRVEAIHRGITWVRLNGFVEPDGIVLQAQNYEDVLFEKDSNNNYLLPGVLGGISGMTPMTVWGKPIVVTSAIVLNSVLVGSFKPGATMWVRSGTSVRLSDSHNDWFIKQLVAVVAEMRAAFACEQPNYFADCDIS